jgi:germacradienol/geosmin synthase
VRELQNWMAGILTWHQGCRRYDEAELRHRPGPSLRLAGPTGLGTSAVRIPL